MTMMESGDNLIVEAPNMVGAAHAEIIIARVDVPMFKAFLRHKEAFEIMVSAEVFEIPYGKAVLNFHNNHIQNINVERRTYQHQSSRSLE